MPAFEFKNSETIANDIINFYLKKSGQYNALIFGFTCFVDTGNGGAVFIDLLNSLVKKKNIY